jgi:hypothetical protein
MSFRIRMFKICCSITASAQTAPWLSVSYPVLLLATLKMSISIHYHTVPNNMFQSAILEFLNPVMLAEKEYEIFTINKSSSLPFGMLPRFKQPNLQSKLYKTA